MGILVYGRVRPGGPVRTRAYAGVLTEMAYGAHEVARIAGISKNTLLRWLKQGKVPEVCRDRNGWRVFVQEDVDRVCAFARMTTPPGAYRGDVLPAPRRGGPNGTVEAA